MDEELKKRRADLDEQLALPWDWVYGYYRHLDGWDLNKNRISKDRYLQELAEDFGPITVPHRQR